MHFLACSQSPNLSQEEEKDWAYFEANKSRLCETIAQCDTLDRLNLLEYTKFIDNVYTKRSKMAEDFLRKYPNSKRYDKVLNWYLSIYFEPKFVAKAIDDKRTAYLSGFTGPIRYGPKVSGFYRALQIDNDAMERWIEKGDRLVNQVLESDASLERKAEVEARLLGRDFNIAKRWYDALPKTTIEESYWSHFDKQYWSSIQLRLLRLLEKYPDYEPLADYIFSLIEDSLKIRSPLLSEEYINVFLEKTNEKNPLSHRKGFKALNDKLKNYVEAIDNLEQDDESRSLDLELVGLDGTKMSLSELRGKVVLIDFWSIRCAPCIREMPHVATLYDKYRNQGFEVVGIVIGGDDVKESVLEIIERQGANWLQHLDRGKDSKVSYHSLYNIGSLPTVWLLDKDGKIVDTNARGERLEPLIKKYLGL